MSNLGEIDEDIDKIEPWDGMDLEQPQVPELQGGLIKAGSGILKHPHPFHSKVISS